MPEINDKDFIVTMSDDLGDDDDDDNDDDDDDDEATDSLSDSSNDDDDDDDDDDDSTGDRCKHVLITRLWWRHTAAAVTMTITAQFVT